MTKLRATVSWEYEALPEWYDGETDPNVWAQVDADNMSEDYGNIADALLNTEGVTVKVEPV